MPRGGYRPGSGRKKGVPNKLTSVQRAAMQAFLDQNWPNAQKMIDQIWKGVPADDPGKFTVQPDPRAALEMLHRFAKFCIPELGRVEHTGDAGGPLEFIVRDIAKEE